jgi:hypothetical protein
MLESATFEKDGMSAPRLLLDPGIPAFERSLLRSWSDEEPSTGARERVLAIAAFAGVAGIAAGGAIAPKAMTASGVALMKWLGIGAVVVLAVGTASYVRTEASEQRAGERTAPTARPSIATAPTPPPASPDTTSGSVTPIAPAVAPAPPSAARAREHSMPPSTLSDQVEDLDRIRAAIAAGEATRALHLVDDYNRRFPRGAFSEEAEVLRIEALIRRGDRVAASRAAERFLASHPASPHAARLRALTGSVEP